MQVQKGKNLLIVLLLLVCFWMIWFIDFNHLAFTLTPWKNLGTPPEIPLEIVSISKIIDPFNSMGVDPIVFVETEGMNAYRYQASLDQWEPSGHGYDYRPYWDDECTIDLKDTWGVKDRSVNALSYESYGWCKGVKFPVLTVFQVKNNQVWGKYLQRNSWVSILDYLQIVVKTASILLLIWMLIRFQQKGVYASMASRWTNLSKSKKIGIFSSIVLGILAGVLTFKGYQEIVIRDFAGDYLLHTGFWSHRISVRRDNTFSVFIDPDFGGPISYEGKVVLDKEKIHLTTSTLRLFTQFPFVPIKWGERRYLVETERMESFCIATMKRGVGEPRMKPMGFYYLRDGDWHKPATGVPVNIFGQRVCPKSK